MHKWRGKVAVVTGASAGIGAAISRHLAQEGMTVIGCARNVAKIDVRQSPSTHTHARTLLHYRTAIYLGHRLLTPLPLPVRHGWVVAEGGAGSFEFLSGASGQHTVRRSERGGDQVPVRHG